MNRNILDQHRSGCILGHFSKSRYYMKGSNWPTTQEKLPNPPYVDKTLSLNAVICFKCMEIIEYGDWYVFSKAHKHRVPKYYHDSCYQKMLY